VAGSKATNTPNEKKDENMGRETWYQNSQHHKIKLEPFKRCL
jgi:hypothetical protein